MRISDWSSDVCSSDLSGRIRLALVGGILRGVEQHDLNAGLGRYVCNAGAHHAGAEDAELVDLCAPEAFRSRLALVDRVELEPQRADHVLRDLRADAVREVARFEPAGGIEVDEAALETEGP